MSGVAMAADRAALESNVRRFYVYRFLVNMQLWLPIWVLYLQEERGLTLAQITGLDVPIIVSAGITLATAGIVLRFHEPPREDRERPHPFRALRSAVALSWGHAPLRYLLLFSAALTAASFAPVVFVQPFL